MTAEAQEINHANDGRPGAEKPGQPSGNGSPGSRKVGRGSAEHERSGDRDPGARISGFANSAVALSRSPLGIIALFIVLVYGFAALVVGVGTKDPSIPIAPLIWFLVTFPFVVLAAFVWLVAYHHAKLFGPQDFDNQELFLRLQADIDVANKKMRVLAEVAPVAVDLKAVGKPQERASSEDDTQKGKWGGQRENGGWKVFVKGPITPLSSDPDYFRVCLNVVSTDPERKPLTGRVSFYLHDTFRPEVETVMASNGIADLEIVSYGAFTVGVECEDGTPLEIDLADEDIEAPRRFKIS